MEGPGHRGPGNRRRLISGRDEPSEALPQLLQRHLAVHPDLLPCGSTVLVGVSGGPDSKALLLLLADMAPALGIELVAAHFDHGLRPESAAQAHQVSRSSRDLGVRCHVGRSDHHVRPTQADLRAARYRWLEQIRRVEDAERVAVGHHGDDQVETVLFRLMRGGDLKGLAGIPARRDHLVRPLLPFRRVQLAGFLRDRDVPWIEDPSNLDPRWVRSRIRTQVLPALRSREPEVDDRLLALSRAAARAEGLLETMAAKLWRRATASARTTSGDRRVDLDRRTLLAAHSELRGRLVRRIARELGVGLTGGGTRAGVQFISEGRSGGRIDLGGGVHLAREYERITVAADLLGDGPRPVIVSRSAPGSGSLRIGGRSFALQWRPMRRDAEVGDRIAVPVPRGHYPLRFREWRPGDRIRLAGGTRKLKKLFNDHRIPAGERAGVPVLVDSADRVLWVAGIAMAAVEQGIEYERDMLELELADE